MKPLYWIGRSITHITGRFVFGIRLYGREYIPKSGPFILASNHISYFDPPLVGSFIPRELFFFAKKELFDNKILGWIIWRTNARPVRRGQMDRQALATSLQILREGYGLTMFPEGTRSKTRELLPPKPGLGLLAAKAACPVVPAYIHGANRLKDCFLRRDRLSLSYGEPIPPDWIAARADSKEGYLEITAEVMRRIVALRDSLPSSSR
ncbi:MAG: lysophospholipid acyltransferase family protein [candidate division Zixibacteria bacterium]|jgi:1-acyl-sn-glycerol-3-phosphate acyltransferase|nr:lysophospholipid acyltransferase family protein [candidate division Zixibacteria bacterium]